MCADGSSAAMASSYACELMVPCVPMTPTLPERVARAARESQARSLQYRKIVFLPCVEAVCCGGVTRDDNSFNPDHEERSDLRCANHSLGTLRSIRNSRGVAEIDDASFGSCRASSLTTVSPPISGIEHPNRRSAPTTAELTTDCGPPPDCGVTCDVCCHTHAATTALTFTLALKSASLPRPKASAPEKRWLKTSRRSKPRGGASRAPAVGGF